MRTHWTFNLAALVPFLTGTIALWLYDDLNTAYGCLLITLALYTWFTKEYAKGE